MLHMVLAAAGTGSWRSRRGKLFGVPVQSSCCRFGADVFKMRLVVGSREFMPLSSPDQLSAIADSVCPSRRVSISDGA